jgi:hypothetical protein
MLASAGQALAELTPPTESTAAKTAVFASLSELHIVAEQSKEARWRIAAALEAAERLEEEETDDSFASADSLNAMLTASRLALTSARIAHENVHPAGCTAVQQQQYVVGGGWALWSQVVGAAMSTPPQSIIHLMGGWTLIVVAVIMVAGCVLMGRSSRKRPGGRAKPKLN